MTRRLPPLNGLRAFEAAARHMSFTTAAEELHVTQAAISRQVKLLEEHLGADLFRRYNRRLELTDGGRAYFLVLRHAFNHMDLATKQLFPESDDTTLKVSVLNSLAQKWLLPRLSDFQARAPNIEVLLSASDRLVDFSREDFHIALRYGAGGYRGLEVQRLMTDKVFPVCSPRLLEGDVPLRAPKDLANHALLHDILGARNEDMQHWGRWLTAAGAAEVDHTRGPAFNQLGMILAAAVDGQGVALGRLSLTADDLAAGHLVCPFGPVLDARYATYMVSPASTVDLPKVRLFREWLLEEAAKTMAQTAALPEG
ncbi:MAG: transcriptional regulator GcvA [Pseudomonadota bacterium]